MILLKSNLDKAENSNETKSNKLDKLGYLTSLDTSRLDE